MSVARMGCGENKAGLLLGRRVPVGFAAGGGGVSRRGALTGVASAVFAALGLTACAEGPVRSFDEAAAVVAVPPPVNPALRMLIEGEGDLVVGGARLNAGLLRKFYGRRGFEAVWASRTGQAEALKELVLRAGEHGLDPALFHGPVLRGGEGLSALEREVVLSDAVLSFADALARGAVPPERRRDDEVLAPEPVDVAAVLDGAVGSPDPEAVIEALAPSTPTYRALREALERYRGSGGDLDTGGAQRGGAERGGAERVGAELAGRVVVEQVVARRVVGRGVVNGRVVLRRDGVRRGAGGGVVSGRVSAERERATRLRAIEVNLERQRWLPRRLPANRVWVNVADERLVLYRADEAAFSTRVVVGEDVERNQSPEFRATIDASFYNPPWVVPADIAAAEILPKLTKEPDYLTRNNMVLLASGEVEQKPGPEAGLGLVMFDMPNKFDVYLHDTPDRTVFALENRRISHGCIRVQNPRELAALLMDQPLETVDEGIAGGSTTRNALPAPVAVFVVYQTAFLDGEGALQFRPDFYKRDAAIWRLLQATASL